MAAGKYLVQVEQGSVFTRYLTWKDSAGNPINITGYTARMFVKQTYEDTVNLFEMTTENGRISLGGVAGTINLYISANDTDDLEFGSYVYDLKMVPANTNNATRILQGEFIVAPQVTV